LILRKKDQESYVFLHRTNTLLDDFILFFCRRVGEHLEKTKGSLSVYMIKPLSADEMANESAKAVDLDLCRDLYLLFGAEEYIGAKLGAHSHFKTFAATTLREKNLTLFLKNKKDFNFQPIKEWVASFRSPDIKRSPSYSGNIRVLLAMINKFYYSMDLYKWVFYALQNVKETRITPAELGSKYNFKVHSLENLKSLCSAEEARALSGWFASEEANQLQSFTRTVFSEHKYYLLFQLQQASNAFDHKMSKAIIRCLYIRNKHRSTLQARKRQEASRSAGHKAIAQPIIPKVTFKEVIQEVAKNPSDLYASCPLIIVGGVHRPELNLESWISITQSLLDFDKSTLTWRLKGHVRLNRADNDSTLGLNPFLLQEAGVGISDLQIGDLKDKVTRQTQVESAERRLHEESTSRVDTGKGTNVAGLPKSSTKGGGSKKKGY